jgi:hypothetical protein
MSSARGEWVDWEATRSQSASPSECELYYWRSGIRQMWRVSNRLAIWSTCDSTNGRAVVAALRVKSNLISTRLVHGRARVASDNDAARDRSNFGRMPRTVRETGSRLGPRRAQERRSERIRVEACMATVSLERKACSDLMAERMRQI